MAHFKIGDSVVKIDSGAHGTVINVRSGRGRVIYTVVLGDGTQSNVLEPDLRADFDVSDPFERCKSGIFGSYSDYSKKNTTFKIRNSNNSTISSLKASRTLFRTYQFKPLLKFLNSPNRRLLVADEVGLGKTIEAGHIMLELKARKELRNVLIVCPKSLQEKWKAELYEKFGLTFKIVDTAKELINDLNAKTGTVRAIVNYEKIRGHKSKGKEDRAKNGKMPNTLIDYLMEHPQRFSMVLCDEAHKMRNRETQTYKGAEVLMNLADTALFLTATPVMISQENLYNLLHLLDNSRFFRYDIFENRMAENRPFIKALSQVNNNVPLKKIKEQLLISEVKQHYYSNEQEIFSEYTTIYDIFQKDPIFQEITDLCEGEDNTKVRARLQYLFSSMSMMNSVFSRTRKREVTTDFSQTERKPHPVKIDLTPDEQEVYNECIDQYADDNSYTDEWGDDHLSLGGALGLVQKKRMIASSVWAYANDDSDLEHGYDAYADCRDAKVEKLLEVIKEVFANGTHKLIVFALFRKTLRYLQIRLKKAGYNAVVIHGQIDNRDEILQQFKTEDNIQILLSSEVGSEGLDMQFCNSMVNYDLPWNPMVVEQRIGRIDRFGQKSPIVNIYNFIVAGSIQEEIYIRLLERIGIFQGTVGDMEAILDAEIHYDGEEMTIQKVYSKMEKEFFTKQLTQQEREKKIAEVEQAIANEKEHLQHLQEGLSNTLTNDAYFRDEISRILNNNSYVTKEELQNFMMAAIRQKLTTCNMDKIKEDIWEFKIPVSQPTVLKNFLTQYCPLNDEYSISLNQFKRKIDDKLKFLITFSQDVAFDDRNIYYLNIYHPMIQACLKFFEENTDETKTSFSYSLCADELLQEGTRYYMGIYEIDSQRMVQGVKKKNAILLPVVFNLQTDKIEEDQNVIDRIYRRSQVEGAEHNATNEDIKAETIDNMSYDFAEFVSSEIRNRLEEEKRQTESDRQRNEQQTKEYYKSRIAGFEATIKEESWKLEWDIDDKERLATTRRVQLAKNQIGILERERDERLARINEDRQVQMQDKLISLNLITII